METARSNYSKECEETVNQIIGQLVQMELFYESCATVATNERCNYQNTANFMRSRANRMYNLRHAFIDYQVSRSATYSMSNVINRMMKATVMPSLESSNCRSNMKTSFEEMYKMVMEMAKKVEEYVRDLISRAKEANDPVTERFATQFLSNYHHMSYRQIVNVYNTLIRSDNMATFDRHFMARCCPNTMENTMNKDMHMHSNCYNRMF